MFRNASVRESQVVSEQVTTPTWEFLPTVSTKLEEKTDTLDVSLTQEENDKYYDHCEKHFVPEPRHTAPDPQVENALPSATAHTDIMTIIYRQAVCT